MRMSMTARLGRHSRTSRISSDPSPARPTTSYPPCSSRLARPSRINTSSSATMTRVPRGSTSVTARVSRSTLGRTRPSLRVRTGCATAGQEQHERSLGSGPGSMIYSPMPSPWLAVEAGTDLLARARQIQGSWESLLVGGALDSQLPSRATAGMRPVIVESWRRVAATGLDPIDLLPSVEADPSETRERWLEHPLGLLQHVLVEPLQLLAEESNSMVQVTDPSGLTLFLGGPDSLKERAAEMNLVEGARCSETVNGTNGVGTALAEDHPVQVFAFEHFSHHHREWVCSGAPIHDLVSGQLVGVIDLSSPWKIAHPRSLELVADAARTTEQCLLEGRRDRDARLRRRYGDLTTKTSDLLVNREGYLLIGDDVVHPQRLDIPENGGEIAMGDGSLAVAEPLGRGEAYLVHRPRKRAAPPRGLRSPGAGAHLSAYLEAAIDCVIVADASGRIVEFNPAAERTFGYSRKEALGRTMAELIVPPSLRERHTAAFARYVKTREGSMLGRRVELTGMRADGSEFPVELALSQVEAEPVLICGALRDISATKRTEKHLRELAEEQAALRQVATLVAYESSADRLIAVVAEQVARVFDVPLVRLLRYEPSGSVVIGGFSESDDEPFPIGSRWPLDTPGLLATIRHTGHAARVEDYAQTPGDGAAVVRAAGMRSAVGSPIVVEGRVWGAIVLLSPRRASLLEDAEARLADFTELVATALANAESRAALSRLADEQAALRRVATLVAREASPVELLETVADEVARVVDVEAVGMLRFEQDGTASLVAQSDTPWDPLPLGTRFALEGENVVTAVFRTREAARLDDWAEATGPVAAMASVLGIRSSVATPIVVEGRLWGTLVAVTSQSTPLPRETDSRIGEFTELVATAIANAEARGQLSTLVEEQAALRRVATLVAEGAAPTEVFDAVIAEVGQLLGAAQVGLARYENEHEISVLAIRGQSPEILRAGMRLPLDGDSVNARILRTGRSTRLNFAHDGDGSIAEILRRDDVNATVGAPIVVDGAVWGVVAASWRGHDQPPADAEERLAQFAELLDTAIANADSRDQLMASRARVIAAADESRRRIERDLHDGAQQRLVTLAAALRRVDAKLPPGADELRADLTRVAEGLTTAVDELRELSRGIHPSILTEGGLSPALKALGRRSPVRVKLDMGFEQRLPDQVEVAAYYTVSEALTNASKHANATRVWVSLRVEDDTLLLSIRDDGVGGADSKRGSGLTGLRDRIEALGGRIQIESPSGSGTLIEVGIPIAGPADRDHEPDARLAQATTPGSPG